MTEKEMRCVKALRICHSHGDCRDCEFMESDIDEKSCVHVMFEDAADIIESLSERLEAAQPKWISVEDELPKKWRENDTEHTLVNYQVYSPRYGVDIGNYVKPAGRWVIMGLPVDDVTHWMPLPDAPKEVG